MRAGSAADRTGADLGAAEPALPLESLSLPRREAVPAVPLPRRGDAWPDDAPPSLARGLAAHEQAGSDGLGQRVPVTVALAVVCDALRSVPRGQRPMLAADWGALLAAPDSAELRAAVADVLGVAHGQSLPRPTGTSGGAIGRPSAECGGPMGVSRPRPEAPCDPPRGAAWSLDLTRGDAQRWPEVWAQWLPRWIERAAALGVVHREWTDHDVFRGPRQSLLALGIVRDGDFPGDAGRGRSMVTFACDGQPKHQGEGSAARSSALRVAKLGGRFAVLVFAPAAVEDERRALAGWPVWRDGQWASVAAPSVSAPDVLQHAGALLRLVHSRGAGEPPQAR